MKKLPFILFLFVLFAKSNFTYAQDYAVIEGIIDVGSPDEIVSVCMLKNDGTLTLEPDVDSTLSEKAKDRRFKFHVPIKTDVVHVEMKLLKRIDFNEELYFPSIFLEKGDSIFIHINTKKEFLFSGNARKKFELVYQLNQIQYGGIKGFSTDPAIYYKEKFSKLEQAKRILLEAQESLDAKTLRRIELDYFGSILNYIYYCFHTYKFGYLLTKEFGNSGVQIYRQHLYQTPVDLRDTTLLQSSLYYCSYLMNKAVADAKYEAQLQNVSYDPIAYLKKTYPPGILREKILMNFLFGSRNKFANYFYQAQALIESPDYKERFAHYEKVYVKPIQVESNVVFIDNHNQKVRLSDFKGKLVVVDMWYTGCLPCAAVAKAMPNVENAFKERDDVVFVSLSVDLDKDKWLRSIASEGMDLNSGDRKGFYYASAHTRYWNIGSASNREKFAYKYNIFKSYPFLFLLDREGRMVSRTLPRPETDEGKGMINLIKSYL